MTHELPALEYDYDSLEPFIDGETMKIHHSKHHQTYVDKLNAAIEGNEELEGKDVEELLKSVDSVPGDIKQAVINHGGGHANHSLFWKILKKDGGKPSEELGKAMIDAFGSMEETHKKFVETASTLFGSGWAWIVVNEDKKLEIITTSNQDSPLMEGKIPILGVDVWEHAYYLKYQNKRPDYIEAFTKVINWERVSELFSEAIK